MSTDRVKVVVRVRPPLEAEGSSATNNGFSNSALDIYPFTNQIILSKFSAKKPFVYDFVFEEMSSQEVVFDKLGHELICNLFEGYNSCFFAYGQNGSGKNYTMYGDGNERQGFLPRLYVKIFEHISQTLAKLQDEDKNPALSPILFKVEISFVEVYNENVYDLLTSNKIQLKVREHSKFGSFVEGLSQRTATSPTDIENIINEGLKRTVVRRNNISRSHTVLTIKVTMNDKLLKGSHPREKVSKISIVYLAPLPICNEDKLTKEEVNGLNKSLSALGNVVSKSAEEKPLHIPFRDSVLTLLLKDSLVGRSRIILLATVSSSIEDCEKTLSTLRYAERAKKIAHNPIIKRNENISRIKELKKEKMELKKMLEKQTPNDCIQKQISENEEQLQELELLNERENRLRQMGISIDPSGIHVDEDLFCLVSISTEISTDECDDLSIYYLKETTTVGHVDSSLPLDIKLSGEGIASPHCEFNIGSDGNIYLIPYIEGYTSVNGEQVSQSRKLRHGDNIQWGTKHLLRLHTPKKCRLTALPVIPQSPTDPNPTGFHTYEYRD